jgi:hypothetical protein
MFLDPKRLYGTEINTTDNESIITLEKTQAAVMRSILLAPRYAGRETAAEELGVQTIAVAALKRKLTFFKKLTKKDKSHMAAIIFSWRMDHFNTGGPGSLTGFIPECYAFIKQIQGDPTRDMWSNSKIHLLRLIRKWGTERSKSLILERTEQNQGYATRSSSGMEEYLKIGIPRKDCPVWARFRMGCPGLNYDNVLSTTINTKCSCPDEAQETMTHAILECMKHTTERQTMYGSLERILGPTFINIMYGPQHELLNFILYGQSYKQLSWWNKIRSAQHITKFLILVAPRFYA